MLEWEWTGISDISATSQDIVALLCKSFLSKYLSEITSSVVDELEASGLSNGSSGQLSVAGLVGVREVDNKTLEKLSERSYHKDYMRLGLGSLGTSTATVPPRNKSEFRITSCNINYQLCRRYGFIGKFCHKSFPLYLKKLIKLLLESLATVFVTILVS